MYAYVTANLFYEYFIGDLKLLDTLSSIFSKLGIVAEAEKLVNNSKGNKIK